MNQLLYITGLLIGLLVPCRMAYLIVRRYIIGTDRSKMVMLKGKTVIVTGGNSGIGKATVRELARRKARVILACRDTKRANPAVKDIRRETQEGELVVKSLDLASFKSIRRFAEEILEEESRLDIIINNAGVLGCPYSKTEDGIEMHMGVNHFGHFLLNNLLMKLLEKSAPSRIVLVSGDAYKIGSINFDDIHSEKSYGPIRAYCASKLANILHGVELAKRLRGKGVSVYTLHPGVISTEITRYYSDSLLLSVIKTVVLSPMYWFFCKTIDEGCATTVYCATAEEVKYVSGKYYRNSGASKPWQRARDAGVAKKLWDLSEQITGSTLT